MAGNTPKRIVLRVNEMYETDYINIVDKFLQFSNYPSTDDYFIHLLPANTSNKMHVVLDMHCKEFPSTDVSKLKYEVFKVKKTDDYLFEPLLYDAPKLASQRGLEYKWGTDR